MGRLPSGSKKTWWDWRHRGDTSVPTRLEHHVSGRCWELERRKVEPGCLKQAKESVSFS